jgi:hypothetical protein
MKPAPIPWMRCLPGCAAADDRRVLRLDRDRFEVRVLRLMKRPTPVIVPPVPTPATIASIRPPLSSQISGPVVSFVDRRVGRVFELLRHPGVALALDQIVRRGDRPLHALGRRGQHQIGPHGPQQHPPFDRHRFGHRQGQPILLGRTDERQRDPRVAAGRFDDVRLWIDLALALSRFDHRRADAVLDAVQRVEKLALGEHRRLIFGNQSVDANHRRIADRKGCVVEGLSAWHRLFISRGSDEQDCTASIVPEH